MVVAKRQGREKSMKIEQRNVEDQSENLRSSKQHSWLAHRADPGGGKNIQKDEPKDQGSLLRAFSLFSVHHLG